VQEETVFSHIIDKEVSAEILYEDDDVIAFKDINPQAPLHVLIVSKKIIPKLTAVQDEDTLLMGKMVMVAKKIAQEHHLDEDGFRLLMNEGKFGGQTIYHIHFHLLGGRRLMWPPG
jgi:histidine triad (HIT) family protein